MTHAEWAKHLTEFSAELDRLKAESFSGDAPHLKQYVDDAQNALGHLAGYLIG